jgi:hypothetical protein
MKPKLCVLVLTILGFTPAGCGYTQLERHFKPVDPCVAVPDSTKPDLAFTRYWYYPYWGSETHDRPIPVTRYILIVENIGESPFDASVMLRCADRRDDLVTGKYPNYKMPFHLALAPGDTTQLTFEGTRWPPPSGYHIKFILLTDTYPVHTFDPVYYFGREPVCEISTHNNICDIIAP